MSKEMEEGEVYSDEEGTSKKKKGRKRETSSESGEITDPEETLNDSEDVSQT
jgi:hypothetical protein